MLRKKGLLISVALAVIVGALLLWIVTGRDSRPAPVSSLAFEEIRRHVGSAYTGPQLRQVSRRMAGTRVRWTGTVVDISRKGIVRVAVGDSSSANAEFQASAKQTRALREEEGIALVGTIEEIGVLETFPPMPHPHVYLREVRLE